MSMNRTWTPAVPREVPTLDGSVSVPSFSNWAHGEPGDSTVGEDCAYMKGESSSTVRPRGQPAPTCRQPGPSCVARVRCDAGLTGFVWLCALSNASRARGLAAGTTSHAQATRPLSVGRCGESTTSARGPTCSSASCRQKLLENGYIVLYAELFVRWRHHGLLVSRSLAFLSSWLPR